MRFRILCFVLILVSSAAAFGQTTTWIGGAAGNWETAGNWDNGVPGAAFDVIVNGGGGVDITLNTTDKTITSLTLTGSVTLSEDTDRSLTVSGATSITGGTLSSDGVDLVLATLTNSGTSVIETTAAAGTTVGNLSIGGLISDGAGTDSLTLRKTTDPNQFNLPQVGLAGDLVVDMPAVNILDDSGAPNITVAGNLDITINGWIELNFDEAGAGTFNAGSVSFNANLIQIYENSAASIDGTATTLQYIANGNITENGAATQAGTSTLNAGANNIVMNTQASLFGTLAATGATVRIRQGGAALTLGAINADLFVLNSAGAVDQTGADGITNSLGTTAVYLAGAGGFTLNDTNNDIGTLASGTTSAIEFYNSDNLSIGTVDGNNGIDSGNQNVTLESGAGLSIDQPIAAGAGAGDVLLTAQTTVTQNGAAPVVCDGIELYGTAVFTLTAGGNDAAEIAGDVTGAGSIEYVDSNALRIFNLDAEEPPAGLFCTNDILLTAGGIDQGSNDYISADGLLIQGTGTFDLIGVANDVNTLAVNVTGPFDFQNTNGFTIGTVNAVNGITAAGGNNVVLQMDNAGATVTQSQAVSASGLALRGAGAFNLSGGGNTVNTFASDATGDISYTGSTGVTVGLVSDSDGTNITGIATSGANVVLTASNGAVDFDRAVSLGAGNLTITTSGAGGVTQAAAGIISTTGTTAITSNAGTAAITLNQGNDFNIVVLTGSTVDLADTSAITLGNLSAGSLSLTAGGAVNNTATAAVSVTGLAFIDAGTTITLGTLAGDTAGFGSLRLDGTVATITESGGAAGTVLAGSSSLTSLTLVSDGPVTQAGGSFVTVTGVSDITAGAGASDITLDLAANNNFGSIVFDGADVVFADLDAIDISGASTADGTLTITTGGGAGDDITDTGGSVTVTGLTTFNIGAGGDVLLNSPANDFAAAGISIPSGTDVTLVDANDISLNAISISGNLYVETVAGTISTGGALSIGTNATFVGDDGQDILLTDLGNSFGGALSITAPGIEVLNDVTVRHSTTLDLGPINAGGALAVEVNTGNITNTGGGLTVVGGSTFTAPNGSSITVDNTGNDFTGPVSFTSGGTLANISVWDSSALSLAGGLTVSNVLTVGSNGTVSQGGVWTGSDLIVTTYNDGGANITLGGFVNVFDNVSLRAMEASTPTNPAAGAISYRDTDGFTIFGNGMASTAALNLQNGGLAGDTITNGGVADVIIGGTTTLTLGAAAGSITGAGNDFNILVSSGTGALTIVDDNGITLGNLSAGSLSLTAGGAVNNTATAAVSVTGLAFIDAGTTITLGTLAGDTAGFGSLRLDGTVATITESGGAAGTVLAGSSSLTSLTLVSDGPVTQAGGSFVAVTGVSDITAGAGASDITLDLAANNNFGSIVFDGADVVFADLDAIDISGASTADGTLTITTGGGAGDDITDTGGSVTVTGLTTFNIGAGGDVLLNSPANDFAAAGISIPSGTDVTLVDANDISLNAISISGNLYVETVAGTISTGGALSIGTNATFVGDDGQDILLTDLGNSFGGALSITAPGIEVLNDVTVRHSTTLDLGPINAGGALAVEVNTGNITNTGGGLTVVGGSTFTAPNGSSITVDNTGNDFTGPVSFTSGGTLANISVWDSSALSLAGGLTVSNVLTVGSNGTVSQGGVWTGSDLIVTTYNDGGANITLGGFVNVFDNVSLRAMEASTPTNPAAGAISYRDTDGFTIFGNGMASTAALNLQNGGLAGDTITNGGVADVIIGGTTTLTLGAAAGSITGAGNDFNILVSSGTGALTIVDDNGITLGNLSAGSLSLTAGGAVNNTATAAVSVTGLAFIDAGTTITLGTLAGDTAGFGSLRLDGTVATITESGGAAGTVLAGSSSLTSLTLVSDGPVTQAGGSFVAVTGVSDITAGAGASDITLDLAANNNFGSIVFDGADVVFADLDAIDISGASTADGTLTITTGGGAGDDITDTGGSVTVTGLTTFNIGAGGDVLLNSPANDFAAAGISIPSGTDVTLVDANDISLNAISISGNLYVETVAGTISTGGALSIGTNATFVGDDGQDILLTDLGNTFGGALSITAPGIEVLNDVTVRHSTTLDLGPINAGGALAVEVNTGNITNTGGGLTVVGGSTFTAPNGSSITVDNTGNDFTGPVSFTSGGTLANISVWDSSALSLAGGLTVSNVLTVGSNGTVSQGGVWTGSDLIVTTYNDGGANITLGGFVNVFDNVSLRAMEASTPTNPAAGAISYRDTDGFTIFGNGMASTAALNLQNGGLAGDTITNGGVADVIIGGTTTLTLGAAAGSITGAGNDFNILVSSGTGALTIVDDNAITLGNLSASTLSLTAGGNIGNSVGAVVGVSGNAVLSAAGADITLVSAGGINFGSLNPTAATANITEDSATEFSGGTITTSMILASGGAVTQTGVVSAVTADITANSGASDITLIDASNDFDTIIFDGAVVQVRDTDALALGAGSSSSGNGSFRSGGGVGENITDAGAVTVGGLATFTAGAADVVMNNDNQLTTVSVVSAANATIRDTNAGLILGDISVGTNLSVECTTGAITDTVNVSVAVGGEASISASLPSTVTLGNDAGDTINFGSLAPSGTTVTISEDSASRFSGGSMTDLNITSAAGIDQAAATSVAVTGTATFVTGTAANDITFNQAGNQFGTVVTGATARNMTILEDQDDLILGGLDLNGFLNVDVTAAGGDLSNTSAVTILVDGNADLNAAATIVLGQVAGDSVNFNTTTLSGTTVTISEDSATVFAGTSSITTLTLDSPGSITQLGGSSVDVSGVSTLTANAGAAALTLAGANDFGTIIFNSSTVTINDDDTAGNTNLVIGGGTASGTAGTVGDFTAVANITDSAPFSIDGVNAVTVFDAGGLITIDDSPDLFTVQVDAGTDVTLTDSDDFNVSSIVISGNLAVTANAGAGNITQLANLYTTTTPGSLPGNLTINGIWNTNSFNLHVGGSLIDGGTSSLVASGAEDIRTRGDFDPDTFTAAGSRVIFAGGTAASIGPGSVPYIFNRVRFNKSGVAVTSNDDSTINNTMEMLDGQWNLGGNTHTINSDWDSSDATFTFLSAGSTVIFGGGTSTTVTTNGIGVANESFDDVALNKTSGFTLGLGSNIQIDGDLTVNAGTGALSSGAREIQIEGNWTYDATADNFLAGTGTVTFADPSDTGTVSQLRTGASGAGALANAFNNLVIHDSSVAVFGQDVTAANLTLLDDSDTVNVVATLLDFTNLPGGSLSVTNLRFQEDPASPLPDTDIATPILDLGNANLTVSGNYNAIDLDSTHGGPSNPREMGRLRVTGGGPRTIIRPTASLAAVNQLGITEFYGASAALGDFSDRTGTTGGAADFWHVIINGCDVTMTQDVVVHGFTGTPKGALVEPVESSYDPVNEMLGIYITGGGSLDSGGSTLSLYGSFNNENGTYTHSNSDLILLGSYPGLIAGTNTFFGFICDNQSGGTADVGGKIVYFEQGETTTIVDNAGASFHILGDNGSGTPASPPIPVVLPDGTDWVYLVSSQEGNTWSFIKNINADLAMQYVYVRDSDATGQPLVRPPDVYVFNCPGWVEEIYVELSWTRDTDSNGRIDGIRVQTAATVNMDFSDFVVAVDGYTVQSYADDLSDPTNTFFWINLNEGDSLDTGVTPAWRIETNTSLIETGPVGAPLSFYPSKVDEIPHDDAPPIIGYTLAVADSGRNEVFFHISEDVTDQNGGTWEDNFDATSLDNDGVTAVTVVTASTGSSLKEATLDIGGPITVADIYNNRLIDFDNVLDIPTPASPLADDAGDPLDAGQALVLTSHRVSDLALGILGNGMVEPVTALGNTQDTAGGGVGVVTSFDGSDFLQDEDFVMEVHIHSDFPGGEPLSINYENGVASSFLRNGLWLPGFDENASNGVGSFSGLVPRPWTLSTQAAMTYTGASNLYDRSWVASDPKVENGTDFEFVFHFTTPDLYTARCLDETASDWFRKIRPWSIPIRNVVTQAGGISILNNIINPNRNEMASLHYELSQGGMVSIQVFDLAGGLVDVLQRGYQAPGEYAASWNGRNRSGNVVARGIYFVRYVGPGGIDQIRKILVVK